MKFIKPFLGIVLVSILLTVNIYAEKVFPNPNNLAQKITNFVIDNGEFLHSGGSKQSLLGEAYYSYNYSYKIRKGCAIYYIRIEVENSGRKILHIIKYVTNLNFDDLKTPADLAEELILGSPKVYFAVRMQDNEIDQKIDVILELSKKGLLGFTIDETNSFRESGIGREVFYNDRILRNGEWIDASPEEIDEAQNKYNEYLLWIATYLKIE